MSQLKDFDVDQLMLMLHGELRLAFEAAQSAEKAAKLRVYSVNVKMGQRNLSPQGGEPLNISLLNPGRYPDQEDWEVNLSYRYGDPLPDIPGALMWVSSRTSGLILERLKGVPVKNIKGVDKAWELILRNAGISTLEELANCPGDLIRKLCQDHKSLLPLEFQTLVLLLAREFIPLKFRQYDGIGLMDFLLQSNINIKGEFQGKLTEPEISSLKSMAAIICTVIDKKIYKDLTLALLAPPDGF